MIRQRTLKNVIRATGVGLHTGEKVYLTLRPAAVDSGIIFRRVDLPEPVEIKASPENVGDTARDGQDQAGVGCQHLVQPEIRIVARIDKCPERAAEIRSVEVIGLEARGPRQRFLRTQTKNREQHEREHHVRQTAHCIHESAFPR